jgi:hypothetical protein
MGPESTPNLGYRKGLEKGPKLSQKWVQNEVPEVPKSWVSDLSDRGMGCAAWGDPPLALPPSPREVGGVDSGAPQGPGGSILELPGALGGRFWSSQGRLSG